MVGHVYAKNNILISILRQRDGYKSLEPLILGRCRIQ